MVVVLEGAETETETPKVSSQSGLATLGTPLQLHKHRIANWICRSTSDTIILKVRGGVSSRVERAKHF